jgi:hypothetical protein
MYIHWVLVHFPIVCILPYKHVQCMCRCVHLSWGQVSSPTFSHDTMDAHTVNSNLEVFCDPMHKKGVDLRGMCLDLSVRRQLGYSKVDSSLERYGTEVTCYKLTCVLLQMDRRVLRLLWASAASIAFMLQMLLSCCKCCFHAANVASMLQMFSWNAANVASHGAYMC